MAKQDRQTEQLAARLGEEFALGPTARTMRARRPRPLYVLGEMVLMADVAVVVMFWLSPYSSAGTRLWWAAGAASGGLLGVILIRRSGPQPVQYVFWYGRGLVMWLANVSPPTVLRWTEIAMVKACISRGDEGGLRSRVHTLTFHTTDSTICTLSQLTRGRDLSLAYADYDRMHAPQRVQPLVEAFRRGKTVWFGDLGISQDGITRISPVPASRSLIPWEEITRIVLLGLEPGVTLWVHQVGRGRRKGVKFALSGRPDAVLIHHLLDRVADQTGLAVTRRTTAVS